MDWLVGDLWRFANRLYFVSQRETPSASKKGHARLRSKLARRGQYMEGRTGNREHTNRRFEFTRGVGPIARIASKATVGMGRQRLTLGRRVAAELGRGRTLVWRQRWFQLTAANQKLALVGERVLVCEQLDGKIRLRYRGRELAWEEVPERPKAAARLKPTQMPVAKKKKRAKGPWKPPADHPWRRG